MPEVEHGGEQEAVRAGEINGNWTISSRYVLDWMSRIENDDEVVDNWPRSGTDDQITTRWLSEDRRAAHVFSERASDWADNGVAFVAFEEVDNGWCVACPP